MISRLTPRMWTSSRYFSADTSAGGSGSTPAALRIRAEYIKPGRPASITKILVVDDEAGILRICARIVRGIQKDTLVICVDPTKPIAPQVVDLCAKDPFDLIIMDGEMPDTTGVKLTALLRAGGFNGYIIANSNNPAAAEKMVAQGADHAVADKVEIFSSLSAFFEPAKTA